MSKDNDGIDIIDVVNGVGKGLGTTIDLLGMGTKGLITATTVLAKGVCATADLAGGVIGAGAKLAGSALYLTDKVVIDGGAEVAGLVAGTANVAGHTAKTILNAVTDPAKAAVAGFEANEATLVTEAVAGGATIAQTAEGLLHSDDLKAQAEQVATINSAPTHNIA